MRQTSEGRFPAFGTSEPLVAQACETFYTRLLRLDPGVEDILKTAGQFPEEPAAQSAAAFLWLFGQTPQAQTESARYLARVETFATRLDPREKAWLGAMRLWHERAFEAAACAFENILAEWPQDLPAIKAVEFLYYILGQHASGARFLSQMERLTPFHGEDPDFLAVKSFAHELCGHMGPAREDAEHALSLTPHNPWAQHALEHVLLWEGSQDEAIQRMEGWLGTWDKAGRVIHCHNAWHVAVTHLDRLTPGRAFTIYDEHVWGHAPGLVVEQLDAIAFLWRAEMAGVPVETERYRAVVPHILPLAETLFMPFVTTHYAFALARAGDSDAVESLLQKVDDRARQDDPEARWAWSPVGRGIIRGSVALAQGNASAAAEWLDPVMDRMTRIGGSDAQDDLFRFAHIDSLKRSGRKADAHTLLQTRLSHKRPSALEEKLLAELG